MRLSHRIHLSIGLLVAAACSLGLPHEPAKAQDAQPDTGPRLSIHLAAEISETDLLEYAALLSLSLPQLQYARAFRMHYKDEVDNTLASRGSGLERMSAEGGRAQASLEWEKAAEIRKKLAEDERLVNTEIKSMDDAFFENMVSLLDDQQAGLMNRVRNRRARARCTVSDVHMAASRVDLVQFLRNTLGPKADLSKVDRLLTAYELSLTPLVEQLDAGVYRIRVDGPAIDAEMALAYADSKQAKATRLAAVQTAREAMCRPVSNLQRQIVDLNDRTIVEIAQILLVDDGRRVLNAYREGIYPDVFPDPLDPSPTIVTRAKSGSLPADLRDRILQTDQTFRESWDSLSMQMQTTCNDWQEETAATLASTRDQQYKDRLRELRAARWKADRAYATGVLASLPPDQALLKRHIEVFLKRAAEIESAAAHDSYPQR